MFWLFLLVILGIALMPSSLYINGKHESYSTNGTIIRYENDHKKDENKLDA